MHAYTILDCILIDFIIKIQSNKPDFKYKIWENLEIDLGESYDPEDPGT